MEINVDIVHTVPIISPALFAVLFLAYSIASVIAQYLSSAITQRWSIEHVQQVMSMLSHISQRKYPKVHLSITIYVILKGMTKTATSKSVTAREHIK